MNAATNALPRTLPIEHRVAKLEHTLGEAPNEATNAPGSGVLGVLVDIRRKIDDAERRRRRMIALVGVPSLAAALALLHEVVKLVGLVQALRP